MARGHDLARPRTLADSQRRPVRQTRVLIARLRPYLFAAFTVPIAQAVPAGQVITATATDAGHNTSEFSAPVAVTPA